MTTLLVQSPVSVLKAGFVKTRRAHQVEEGCLEPRRLSRMYVCMHALMYVCMYFLLKFQPFAHFGRSVAHARSVTSEDVYSDGVLFLTFFFSTFTGLLSVRLG